MVFDGHVDAFRFIGNCVEIFVALADVVHGNSFEFDMGSMVGAAAAAVLPIGLVD